MEKLKSKKSATKRIKIKKRFLQRKKAYKAHLCANKGKKRLRRLSKLNFVKKCDTRCFKNLIAI